MLLLDETSHGTKLDGGYQQISAVQFDIHCLILSNKEKQTKKVHFQF